MGTTSQQQMFPSPYTQEHVRLNWLRQQIQGASSRSTGCSRPPIHTQEQIGLKRRVITPRGAKPIRLSLVQNFLPWWGKCAYAKGQDTREGRVVKIHIYVNTFYFKKLFLLKGQSSEIFDLQFFSSFEPALATYQWVKIFSILVKNLQSFSNFKSKI